MIAVSDSMKLRICDVVATYRSVEIPGKCPGCNRDLTGIGALKESVLADRDWVGRFIPHDTNLWDTGSVEHDYSVGGDGIEFPFQISCSACKHILVEATIKEEYP